MEFFKMKKFRKQQQQQKEKEKDDDSLVVVAHDPNHLLASGINVVTTNTTITTSEEENDDDDDDDDFIMNEVKRRLKELKRNSFMVHIPEEEEDEEEEEVVDHDDDTAAAEPGSNEWRDVEAESRQLWSFFGPFYDNYCNRMLFFDRLLNTNTHLLKQITGSQNPPLTPSPRARSMSKKKLTSPLGCLSLKKVPQDDDDTTQHLQQQQQQQEAENDPYLDLETSYVSQLCLTWEALHCQYTQLTQIINCQSETSKCYNHCAQQFQQFQVLLQRFIENEPFQRGLRPEIYAHTRNSFSKLLQVPNILGQDRKEEEESDMLVHAPDLMRIIESSILTFHMFVKMDNKSNGVRNLFGGGQNQNQMATPLQQVQSLLDKRKVKLKELWKKRKGGKKNELRGTRDEMELLLGLIDVKVISRVLRMVKITKDQLFWSEEKIKKLHLSATTGKLQRDPSPILFPCS